MIQTLKLAANLFPSLVDCSKHVTIRSGYRDIKPGHLVFETPDGETQLSYRVFVTRVVFTKAGLLTDSEAMLDGFANCQQLFDGLRKYYPDLQTDSPVTVIHFYQIEENEDE